MHSSVLSTARLRRFSVMAVIAAALAGGFAFSTPTTQAHAMPKADPTCKLVTGTPLPSPGGAVPGEWVC